MNIFGYDLLGDQGNEGIRYAWRIGSATRYVESAAFANKTKGVESDVCGYTTSVSAGCLLRAQGLELLQNAKHCRNNELERN